MLWWMVEEKPFGIWKCWAGSLFYLFLFLQCNGDFSVIKLWQFRLAITTATFLYLVNIDKVCTCSTNRALVLALAEWFEFRGNPPYLCNLRIAFQWKVMWSHCHIFFVDFGERSASTSLDCILRCMNDDGTFTGRICLRFLAKIIFLYTIRHL